MARARLRLPDDLEHLTKDQMTRSIDQACLGIEDTLIAQQYLLDRLLRQYMHNTEIAVTMRLSTILKTIKQPL